MSSTTSFEITRFKYRNGTSSFRVSGWLHGVRIRKNLATREEAAVEKNLLEIRATQAAAGLRATTTFLTDLQLREAEDAFRRMDGRSQSLLTYLDYAFLNYRDPVAQKRLADAVQEYLKGKKLQHDRLLLSAPQLRCITAELNKLLKHYPTDSLDKFTPSVLLVFMERRDPSLKTYNNRRAILSTFFKFAMQQEWIVSNPVEKTPYHRIRHRRGSATTITAAGAADLMANIEQYEKGVMVPYFAICLFAGIRPCTRFGEISKLQAASVRLDTGVIHIEPEVSKVRMKRNVTIQPNLAAWLRAYPLDRYPILPTNAEELRGKLFRKYGLTHDVLRHTFISMFVGKFRSMGEAALQAGNSESIIRKHYLDLKSTEEAEQFFGIMPRHAAPKTKNDNALSPASIAA